jgi:hypothetical protein
MRKPDLRQFGFWRNYTAGFDTGFTVSLTRGSGFQLVRLHQLQDFVSNGLVAGEMLGVSGRE